MKNNYSDRTELAGKLFLEGYNCAQSVFAAFADLYGIDHETALRLSASFGGGIGRMRETCGAACGLFMLAGLYNGSTKKDDREGKSENYALVQKLSEQFRSVMGALRCAEILKIRPGTPMSPVAQVRDAEYYRTRPCLRNVEAAAEIWGQFISENGLKK